MSATGDHGFTLIEAMVVLAVLGLIGGLGFPRLQQAVQTQQFRAAGSATAALLRSARARALRTGADVRLASSADGHGFIGAGLPPVDLPTAIGGSLSKGGIVFYGDGSASGGSLEIVTSKRRLRFEVAPTTGLFRIATR